MRCPDSILIVRRKAIGDVLISLAVIDALVDRWPAVAIDFVVDEAAAEVVHEVSGIRRVLVYPQGEVRTASWARKILLTRRWLSQLRDGHYDIVLDLMCTPQTAIWTRWAAAPVRVGRNRRGRSWAYTHHLPARGDGRFAGEAFLDWVRALGVQCAPWRPMSPFPSLAVSRQTRPISRILFNPSASWPAKAWPREHFAQLGILLAQRGAEVVVAWGPGEERVRDAIVEGGAGYIEALGPTSLEELGEEMASCDLVVGTDSGPKHLAVALGVPTLTLFGSTSPIGWQLPDPQHRWLTHPAPCHPCDLLDCPVAGHPCLDDLQPQSVEREVWNMIARRTAEGGSA